MIGRVAIMCPVCRMELRVLQTNDLEIADYRVLRKLARKEIVLAHVRRIAVNPSNGLKNVCQVIDGAHGFIDHGASYRSRFGEYGVSDAFGKGFWRQHVNRHTQ
jgi:hypothetical protein